MAVRRHQETTLRGGPGSVEEKPRTGAGVCRRHAAQGFPPRALLLPFLPTFSLPLLCVLCVLRPVPPPLLQLPIHGQP